MTYTYIVKCADNTLYTGWTTNLENRLKAHNQGKGAKYTLPRRPVVLLYYEEFQTKQEAMRREAAIKKLRGCCKIIKLDDRAAPYSMFSKKSDEIFCFWNLSGFWAYFNKAFLFRGFYAVSFTAKR